MKWKGHTPTKKDVGDSVPVWYCEPCGSPIYVRPGKFGQMETEFECPKGLELPSFVDLHFEQNLPEAITEHIKKNYPDYIEDQPREEHDSHGYVLTVYLIRQGARR